jgi:hypothetical protein
VAKLQGISGTAVFIVLAGGVLVYSGIKGERISATVRSFLAGQPPTKIADATPSLPEVAGPVAPQSGIVATNQAIGRLQASLYGWSIGDEWNSLVKLWNQESGWNNHAKNPSSGAYGIAQALPPTKYPASAQESGGSSATQQIAWGLSYIHSRYGSPSAAWAHEQANNWY